MFYNHNASSLGAAGVLFEQGVRVFFFFCLQNVLPKKDKVNCHVISIICYILNATNFKAEVNIDQASRE